jgi:hypothetical protein
MTFQRNDRVVFTEDFDRDFPAGTHATVTHLTGDPWEDDPANQYSGMEDEVWVTSDSGVSTWVDIEYLSIEPPVHE